MQKYSDSVYFWANSQFHFEKFNHYILFVREQSCFITASKQNCGKVMFSQVSVCPLGGT